jgi:hypothetical protein
MPIDLDQEILHNMSSASRSAFMGNMISTYILYQIHSNTRYVHTHGPKRNWGTYFGTKGIKVMYVMSNSGTEFWENVLNTCEVFMTGVYGRWWWNPVDNCELQDLVLLKKSEGPQWLDVKCS